MPNVIARFAVFFSLIFLAFLAVPLSAGASVPVPVPVQEKILSYDVAAVFGPTGEMEVTETITVSAAQKNIKRGIYRVLPIWWDRADHKRFRFEYGVKSLLRDGEAEPYRVRTTHGNLEIYAGDKNVILPPGRYVYSLTYTVSNHFSRFGEWDELYWNVTGNDWVFPIDKARFKLYYREAPGAALQPMPMRSIDVYTGSMGKQGKNARVLEDNCIETAEPLARGEGLTIAWTWPRGFLKDAPDPVEYSVLKRLFIPKGKSFLLWGVPLALAAYFMVFVRFRTKTGPMPEVIPLFTVPESFTPGQLRYVANLEYDDTSFAADLLNIVAKGAANIAEWKDSRILKRGPGSRPFLRTATLRPDESAAVEALFARDDSIALTATNHEAIHNARKTLSNFVTHTDDTVLIPVLRYIVVGAILQVVGLPLAATVLFPGGGPSALAGLSIFGGIWIAILFMFTYRIIRGISSFGTFAIRLPVLFFLLPFYAAFVAMCFQVVPEIVSVSGLPDGYGGVFLACLLIWATGSLTIPRRNAEGRRRLAIARGLAMYLGTAERDRFAALYPPERSVAHFEALLPYALALDKGRTWANTLQQYLDETGKKGEAFTDASWNGIRSFRSSTARAVRSPSRSSGGGKGGFSGSGSSGRGSSGRGGGGGGGGGW